MYRCWNMSFFFFLHTVFSVIECFVFSSLCPVSLLQLTIMAIRVPYILHLNTLHFKSHWHMLSWYSVHICLQGCVFSYKGVMVCPGAAWERKHNQTLPVLTQSLINTCPAHFLLLFNTQISKSHPGTCWLQQETC